MKIAVEGCAHGELDKIYETVAHLEDVKKIKVDLLIICGDFQSVRNQKDLSCMACPAKYRQLNTFYKYHSGEKVAPVLTIFIGGNHEASNYLSELFYGGWVCPNIYYLGRAGVIRVNGLRIAGLSGIYKGGDYLKGHFERYPFSEDTKRSVYHIRNLEVFRLKQLKEPVDIFLSHDWPKGVYNYGNTKELLRRKQFLTEEVQSNTLGSRPAEDLLKELKPSYWFAAHLHCKFAAVVPHSEPDKDKVLKTTRFLALDKCLPRRRFLQILDIGPTLPEGESPVLEHDPEWLAVLSSTNHLLSLTRGTQFMPGPGSLERNEFTPSEEEKTKACNCLDTMIISPSLFKKTAGSHNITQGEGPFPPVNPQTLRLCKALGLTDPGAGEVTSSGTSPLHTSQSEDASGNQESGDDIHNTDDLDSADENDNEEVSESNIDLLFVIDRRKSKDSCASTHRNISESMRRSKLVLSSPLTSPDYSSELPLPSDLESSTFHDQSSESREDDCHSSCTSLKNSQDKSTADQMEDSETVKRMSDDSFEGSSVPPSKRVMKRRNLDIYSFKDEDDQ